jgi:hypothetical protein
MIIRRLLLSLFLILAPWALAQGFGQSSSDPGVLVSGNDASSGGIEVSDQGNSNSPGNMEGQHSDGNGADVPNPSTDPIVIKATNAVMFQITSNMKLSQDQINSVQPIIMDYIVKVRDLQQSLEKGVIDSKTMYNKREQLIKDEDRQLSHILSPDQMNVWINMQNP